MRRSLVAVLLGLLAARALSACSEGNVSGDEPLPEDSGISKPITTPDAGRNPDEVDADGFKEGPPDVGPTRVDVAVDLPRVVDVRPLDIPAGNDPCAMRDDGTYCAGLIGLPFGGLVRCVGRRNMGVTPCPAGCLDRPGATDACLDNTVDPCFDERDGLYCGRSIGAVTRADDAFRCVVRRTIWTGTCVGGCMMTATGITCLQ